MDSLNEPEPEPGEAAREVVLLDLAASLAWDLSVDFDEAAWYAEDSAWQAKDEDAWDSAWRVAGILTCAAHLAWEAVPDAESVEANDVLIDAAKSAASAAAVVEKAAGVDEAGGLVTKALIVASKLAEAAAEFATEEAAAEAAEGCGDRAAEAELAVVNALSLATDFAKAAADAAEVSLVAATAAEWRARAVAIAAGRRVAAAGRSADDLQCFEDLDGLKALLRALPPEDLDGALALLENLQDALALADAAESARLLMLKASLLDLSSEDLEASFLELSPEDLQGTFAREGVAEGA